MEFQEVSGRQSVRQRFQTSVNQDKVEKSQNVLGIDGKYQWPVRIFTPLLFLATILVNYMFGFDKNKQVSDKFHLWVTPPGYFFIIWAVIYAGLIVANVYNLIKNVWNRKTHIYFGLSNFFNIMWTIVFNLETTISVVVASFMLIKLTITVYFAWVWLGKIPLENRNAWTYIIRNIFAFYLGWGIAASNLNFGMDIVYLWNVSKQVQMIVFWVMTPLCVILILTYIIVKEKKFALLSSFCILISVVWAFAGSSITSYQCIHNLQQLC